MVGYQNHLQELEELGVSVLAASVDPGDKAEEVAADLSFPVGYGVTRADADALGSWWEERRQIIQPSEFILRPDGKVVASTYSSGPVGRMHVEDTMRLVAFLEKQRKGS